MTTGTLHIHRTYEELSIHTAATLAHLLATAVSQQGVASMALSGGSTPRRTYETLASTEYADRVKWEMVHLFWSDERCVPPSVQESNYRMVRENLISRIRIPAANVHRVLTEHPPEEAARQYEWLVRDWFGLIEAQLPRFDIVLLGLGGDGHTASLFPGSSAMKEQTRLVTSVYVEHLEQYRVTMTLPVFCNAATVIFLVSGASKSKALREVVEGIDMQYPAQHVIPDRGELLWYVDQAAASQLQHVSPI